MEKSGKNFRLAFLEIGSGSGGGTGGVNSLQVLPKCPGSTQKQPRDGSGCSFAAGASGDLHSTRIFPAPAPDFFWCITRFLFKENPNEF